MFIESPRTGGYIWIAFRIPRTSRRLEYSIVSLPNFDYLLPLRIDVKRPIFLLLKIIESA